MDRSHGERLRRRQDLQLAGDDGRDVPDVPPCANGHGAVVCAAGRRRLRARAVLHLLGHGHAGADRLLRRRAGLLRHRPTAGRGNTLEHRRSGRHRGRDSVHPGRADHRPRDHARGPRTPLRLARPRAGRVRSRLLAPARRLRRRGCRSGRGPRRGGPSRRDPGGGGDAIAGDDARPDALGVGRTHRRRRGASRRDRAGDDRSRRLDRADAYGGRLHVRARRLGRAGHGLRGGERGLPGGHVRGPRRGAERRLHRTPPLRGTGAVRGDPRHARVDARPGCGADRLVDPVAAPPSERARGRRPRAGDPDTDRERPRVDGRPDAPTAVRARRRLRPGRAHPPPLAPPQVCVLDRRRGRGALDRLGDVGRDGCLEVLERLRRSLPQRPPETARLGRPGHGRQAGGLHRAEDRRPQRDLVARVLEPRRAQGLEPRRHGSRARADPDAEPAREGRPPPRRPRLRVRRHRQGPLARRHDRAGPGADAARADPRSRFGSGSPSPESSRTAGSGA